MIDRTRRRLETMPARDAAKLTGSDHPQERSLLRTWATCAGLVIAVLIIYLQTGSYEFVNFDDDVHVSANPNVASGLSRDNAVWAFGIHGPSQWHPLAWFSHQLDCTWFGLDSGRHHLMNAGLHALASVLLFLALLRLTGWWGVAAFTACGFAVHPLNVESVAWISERRNVLCAVFVALTLLAWSWYASRPTIFRYLVVAICHAAALMAKPLAVTVPFVLLLLDFWPLGRARGMARADVESANQVGELAGKTTWGRLALEKLPLLALSGLSAFLTVKCQQAVGTVASLGTIPLVLRIANSFAGYGWYLEKAFRPTGLCVFYPHPAFLDADPWASIRWPAIGSLIVLVAITYAVVRRARSSPWLAVGWFWFLGALVPMIGLVQVGEQQYADRYAYLPIVGLFLAIGGLGRAIVLRSEMVARWIPFFSVGVLAVWATIAHQQTTVWRDSISLFSHALDVDSRNHWAHNNLGSELLRKGELLEAAAHFQQSIDRAPRYALGYYNLGVALHTLGKPAQAEACFMESLRHDPTSADTHQRLAACLAERGRFEEAITHFESAVRFSPRNFDARFNLGLMLARVERFEQAAEELGVALSLRPDQTKARVVRSAALRAAGKFAEARAEIERTLLAQPDIAEHHLLHGEISREMGQPDVARRSFQTAIRLKPDLASARAALESLDRDQ